MLQSVFKIEDDSKKDAILEIVSDKYCRTILSSVMEKPKSVIEIGAETEISMSSIYRKIQVLCDNKLLVITGTISDDGKKSFLYKSKIKTINAFYHGDEIKVEVTFN